MPSVATRKLIFHAGGDALERYGVPWRRLSAIERKAPTFTRASTAYYRARDGKLRVAAIDVLRPGWHDLDTAGVYDTLAISLEDARTNLVTDSENFGAWILEQTPVLTSGQADPAGGTAAYLINDDDASFGESIRLSPTFTGGGAKAISIFVREGAAAAAGGSIIILADVTAPGVRLQMDITGWVSGKPTVTATTGTLLDRVQFSGGWWRLLCQSTSVTAANDNRFRILPAGVQAETGDLYIFGAQAEDALFPSSYIKTTGTTASRSAEQLEYSFNPRPQAMTVYVKFIERGTNTIGSGKIIHIGDPTGGTPFVMLDFGGAFYRMFHDNGPITVSSTLAVLPAIGDQVELLGQLNANGSVTLFQSINGGSATSTSPSASATLAASWGQQTLWLNSNGSLGVGFNDFISAKIATGEQTMAAMRAA